jgi:hypothetical protein
MSWRCFAHRQSLWKCNDLSYTIRELGWYWGLWVLCYFLYVYQNAPGKIIWIVHYHNTRWILEEQRQHVCPSSNQSNDVIEPTAYDETLARSIKQSTQQREKGRTKILGSCPNYKSKTQTWSQRVQRNKLLFLKALISSK